MSDTDLSGGAVESSAPVDAPASDAPAPSSPGGPFAGLPPLNPTFPEAPEGSDPLTGELVGEFFPRKVVEDTRRQAADYRTQLRERDERLRSHEERYSVLDGLDDASRDVVLDMARGFAPGAADPTPSLDLMAQVLEAYGYSRQQAEQIVERQVEQQQGEQAAGDDDFDPFDPQSIRSLVSHSVREALAQDAAQRAETARVAQQEQLIADVVAEVHTASGFEPGSFEHDSVLRIAARETNGDVTAAMAKYREREDQIIRRYLEAKGQQPGGALTPPPGGAPPNTQMQPPQTFAEADRAVTEYLRSQAG